jgi:hypothetical protein
MVAQVKSNTFGLGKAKDWENGQSYGLDVDIRFFCGVDFLGSMALNEVMPHMLGGRGSWAIDDGNQVMISHPNETISTTTPMTRASARVPKLRGVNEILDPQCGEVQHQVRSP